MCPPTETLQILQGQHLCCKRMVKDVLEGPLPCFIETETYLCEELGITPGVNISLALNEQLRKARPAPARAGAPWRSVRVACLLAIWGSERRALTTQGILQALINAIPFCRKNAALALTHAPGKKRKGWPV